MISLAIDGSGAFIDLTFFDEKKPIFELYSRGKKTHSQMLIGIMDCALKYLSICLNDIEKLVCVAGPGRHTSIRVVIATLKGLFFNRKDILCYRVNTLDLAAATVKEYDKFRIVGEYFSKEAYFADYFSNNELKRLSSLKKGNVEQVNDTHLPIISVNDLNYGKTRFIHRIQQYMERINLFDLNPIY